MFVNDGGRIKNEFLLSGLIYDVARESGGALVTADHRYSGDNVPTEGSTFEELQFLTVEQALNDIAILIATVQRDLGSSGRVILWGTGYGATLATFARKKFPHLVHAAFASSPYFRAESIDNSNKKVAHINGGIDINAIRYFFICAQPTTTICP